MNKGSRYLPFDALSGYKECLKETLKDYGKIEKPVILEDKRNELDLLIMDSFHEAKIINIIYYKNGYLYNIKGIIDKIDIANKTVNVSRQKLDIDNIINIEN